MRLLFIAPLLSLFISCRTAEGDVTPQVETVSDSMGLALDAYMTQLTKLNRFNGVVFIRKNGKVLVHKAYRMDSTGLASTGVNLTSQFDLRSVSKLLAQVAVLDLEREGQLERGVPVSEYLPDFPNPTITVAYLMEHRSGLPREFSQDSTLQLNAGQVYALIKEQALEFDPGSDQRYSNVGYQLLYYLIGKRTGMPFRDFLDQRYFRPLGMNGTGSNFTPEQYLPEHYAYGHFEGDNGQIQRVEGFLPDEARMGNFHATAADMDRFLHALDPERVAALLEEGVLSHAGGTRGKRAYVHRNFDREYSIVFLANYDNIPFEDLVDDLIAMLEGRSVELPREIHRTAVAVGPQTLARYAGAYDFVDAGHLLLEVRLERDTLWVYQKGANNGPLYPESDTVFFGDPQSEESIVFEPDSTGQYLMWMDFQGVRWKGLPLNATIPNN